ncbi:MAG: hypothetical protein H0X25_15520 [Acidobacteriales bacterium]|nr:hypothetical protein [Terriglobales bacterium]
MVSPAGDNRWRELCEQASTETDPDKLLAIVGEINRILLEKEEEVKRGRAPNPAR